MYCDTVTVTEPNPTYSGGTQVIGGQVTREAGVSCRIQPLSGRLAQSVMGMYPDATHMLYVGDTAVKPNDRVVDQNGQKYIVMSVQAYRDRVNFHHRECVLSELQETT